MNIIIYQTWVGKTERMILTVNDRLQARVVHRSDGEDPWVIEKEAELDEEQLRLLRSFLTDYGFFEDASPADQETLTDCQNRFLYFNDGDDGLYLDCIEKSPSDDRSAIFNLMDSLCALVWRDEEQGETELEEG